MTFSTVLLCLAVAKAASDLLSLFHTHHMVDIAFGIAVLLGAGAVLVADPGNLPGYLCAGLALFWLASGIAALSARKKRRAHGANTR